ncbi:DUF2384 domain-containing protein [Rhodanobacter ginsengiterrae]|uniref:DUF2384 domain-containing protein n=1 Tax=Rhodanobacter ginsengiterrae TaxID=2008451 RepID=UPI003CE6FC1E
MRKPQIRFQNIADEIARINAQRDTLVLGAFEALECRHASLVQVLLERMGSRQRAAYWMCSHQRALSGRSAYELLADGDDDSLWDLLSGVEQADTSSSLRVFIAG